jgi:O-antigen/teichoic acid export membrane protein
VLNIKSDIVARKTIFSNIVAMVFSRLIGGISGIILSVLLARELSPEIFGQYALLINLAIMLSVVSDFGISILTTREIAKNRTKLNDYFIAGSVIKIFFTFLSLCILSIYIVLFMNDNTRLMYAAFAAFFVMFIVQFNEFIISFYNAFENMNYSSKIYLFSKMALFISGVAVVFLFKDKGLDVLFLWQLVAISVVFSFSIYIFLSKVIFVKLRFDKHIILDILKKSIPFGLFSIGGIVYLKIDNLILASYFGSDEVGYYQAAMQLIIVLEVLILISSKAIYPVIARLHNKSKKITIKFIENSLFGAILLGLPSAVFLSVYSEQFILIMYGEDYAPSGPGLTILAWLVPIRFMAHILGTVLSGTSNQKHRAIATWLAALLNIVLNIILIPRYGFIGAAYSMILTSGFLTVYYYISLYYKYSHIRLISILFDFLLPTLVVWISTIMLPFNIIVNILVSLIFYMLSLFILGVINKKNILSMLLLSKYINERC